MRWCALLVAACCLATSSDAARGDVGANPNPGTLMRGATTLGSVASAVAAKTGKGKGKEKGSGDSDDELIGHKLWELAAQGDIDGVTDAVRNGADLNARDQTGEGDVVVYGHTALWAATRAGNQEMISHLLQFHPNVNLPNGVDGKTPLQVAAEKGHPTAFRMLLAYGGKPDAPDDAGVTARKVATAKPKVPGADIMIEDLELFDKDGAAGFEDEPGQWNRNQDEGSPRPYFSNMNTGEVRWAPPPVCAWQPRPGGHPPGFANLVTGQVVWIRPNALCWKYIVTEMGEQVWLNYRTNATLATAPGELPPDLVNDLMQEAGKYWFNEVTGESSWEEPVEKQWKVLKDPEHDRKYWFNTATGESSWTAPEQISWRASKSNEHNRAYYYNDVTQEITWEMPNQLAWSERSDGREEL